MSKPVNPGFILVIDKDMIIESIPINKLKKLDGTKLAELEGKKLVEAKATEVELVYNITVKKKEWNGKITHTSKAR